MSEVWRDALSTAVDRIAPELKDIIQYLHDHPELGYEEVKAQEKLVSTLETHGFECVRGYANERTAFLGKPSPSGPDGPVVAILAEYDALPEIGHGCGHNLSAAAALGAVIAAREVLSGFPGEVVIIGTPAEEVPPSTKGAMHRAGAFAGVDVVLMMHPDDRTTASAGALAVDSFDFVFTGKSSHAAKYAHLGVSALDAALITFTALEFLREHVRDDVRLHGVISEGGSRPSVVPDRAVVRYYVRAKERPYLNSIIEQVLNCARAGALATGAELEVKHLSSLDDLLLVPALNKLLEQNAAWAGAPGIMPASHLWGSNDLGDLSQHIPTSKLKVAFVPEGCPNHTREWAYKTVTPEGLRAAVAGAKAMAATAVQLILEPDVLSQVKADFAAGFSAAQERALAASRFRGEVGADG